MKIKTTPIVNFIDDFKFEREEGTISFDAFIKFTSAHKQAELDTEVHIMSTVMKEKDVICLLNPEITAQEIPYMLDSSTTLVYESQCLSVSGFSEAHGQYNLKIFPHTSWEKAY